MPTIYIMPQADFLEGFPDVPLLSGLEEINLNARFVFDTPTGTIAETTLNTKQSHVEVLKRYNTNLVALGWDCTHMPVKLICNRDQHILTLTTRKSNKMGTIIDLRIDPKQS